MQRKDHMPLDPHSYCDEENKEFDWNMDLLEIHRYKYENHMCLWNIIEQRRKLNFARFEPKKAFVPPELNLCQCLGKHGKHPPDSTIRQ